MKLLGQELGRILRKVAAARLPGAHTHTRSLTAIDCPVKADPSALRWR